MTKTLKYWSCLLLKAIKVVKTIGTLEITCKSQVSFDKSNKVSTYNEYSQLNTFDNLQTEMFEVSFFKSHKIITKTTGNFNCNIQLLLRIETQKEQKEFRLSKVIRKLFSALEILNDWFLYLSKNFKSHKTIPKISSTRDW